MRALFYSHVFLSLCAVAMAAESLCVFDLWNETGLYYLLFVFFATLVAYNIKGLVLIYKNDNKPVSDKLLWAKNNKSLFLCGYGLSGAASVGLFFTLPSGIYFILFPLSILTILYSLPFRMRGYAVSPRTIPFFKTILVALVWVLVVVYLPCYLNGIPLSGFWRWMAGEFVFLFSLSILFDIKDVKNDKLFGIKTFPQSLGINATKIISVLLMGARVLLLLALKPQSPILADALISFLYLTFLVNLINVNRQERFYMLWIDGLMLGKMVVFLFVKLV